MLRVKDTRVPVTLIRVYGSIIVPKSADVQVNTEKHLKLTSTDATFSTNYFVRAHPDGQLRDVFYLVDFLECVSLV